MKCKICGTRLKDGTTQCPMCGAVVGNEETTANIANLGAMKRTTCPTCGKEVIGEHRRCPFCKDFLVRNDFEVTAQQAASAQSQQTATAHVRKIPCVGCGYEVDENNMPSDWKVVDGKHYCLYCYPKVQNQQISGAAFCNGKSYATIQGAIDSCKDGGEIIVSKGTHNEPIYIRKNITLRGNSENPDDYPIIQPPMGARMKNSVTITQGVLKNLHIKTRLGLYCGIYIEGNASNPTIENCCIEGDNGCVITSTFVKGGANPFFKNCKFIRSNYGVRIIDSNGKFENCEFLENQHAISCEGNSKPEFISCQQADKDEAPTSLPPPTQQCVGKIKWEGGITGDKEVIIERFFVVQGAHVKQGELVVKIVEPNEFLHPNAYLKSPAKGTIDILVKPNDRVKPGQLLARIFK